jgi:iron complex outermembrane receptor protein
VNLLVNGMPYRNADGFTDFESLELATTEAVEVYKGGNALRHGGATMGGAINLVTKTGHTAPRLGAFLQGGGHDFQKLQLESGRLLGAFDYYASYAHTSLGGFREWSDQRRDRLNLHFGHHLAERIDFRSFYFFARVREHLPGSVDRQTLQTAPRTEDPVNVANRWGRDYDLHHVGTQLRMQLTPTQRVEFSPYAQYRDIDHPIFRVIAQVSRDVGAELRYESTVPLAGLRNRFTVGLQPAVLNMDNRHYENVAGAHGALRKDQKDRVTSFGAYAENEMQLLPRLAGTIGARFEHSRRSSVDHYLADGDQSDSRTYRPITPRFGLLFDAGRTSRIYANASRSFEPPLLLELNSLTTPGFIALAGQDAWQYELGWRGESGSVTWDAALYDVELRNEILNENVQPFPGAPFTVPTYRNAERTRHSGLELGLMHTATAGPESNHRITSRLSYTAARYRYVRDAVYAGNDIPGAPRHQITGEVKYAHPRGVSITPSIEWVPAAYYVNSGNTEENDAWYSVALRGEWIVPAAGVVVFLEGRNLTNRTYSASVQVDNAAGKFYEPADRRVLYGGMRWTP